MSIASACRRARAPQDPLPAGGQDQGSASRAQIPARRRPRDRGITLTEIVITVALMSIVVVAMMSVVTSSIRVSSTSRAAARVETAIVNTADRINRADNTKCDYTVYAQAAMQTEGWSSSQVQVTHQYWDPDTGSWQPWDPAVNCPSGSTPPAGIVRKVTIRITSPNGEITRSIEVVKSDV